MSYQPQILGATFLVRPVCMYVPESQKVGHYYFYNNVGKYRPIFIFFHCLYEKGTQDLQLRI